MKTYLLGIDVGTTNWKAGLFEPNGKIYSLVSHTTLTHFDKNENAYYLPQELSKTIFNLVKQLTKKVKDPKCIRGIAITGMAEAGVPINKEGNWLYPAITWFDKRTQPQMNWWKKNCNLNELYKITGLDLSYIYSINKIMWLKENEPDIFKKIFKWLCIPDYIAFKLTGEMKMDYSIASRTMAFDISKKMWSSKLCNKAGIDSNIFPDTVQSGTLIGKVTSSVFKQTGLAIGTPVCAGGHDHVCGAYAVGAVSEEKILDSMGTAESIFTSLNNLSNAIKVHNFGFSTGRHVYPNKFYVMGGIYSSGAIINWIKKELFKDINTHQKLIDIMEKMYKGPSDIFMLPHLLGSGPPKRDSLSRAAYIGLTPNAKREDLLIASIEGIFYEAKTTISAIKECTGIKSIDEVILIGKMAMNKSLMDIKASILQTKIKSPKVYEAVLLGASMLAGVGSKIYKNADDAIKKVKMKYDVFYPDPSKAKQYSTRYNKIYKKIYPALQNLNKEISEL